MIKRYKGKTTAKRQQLQVLRKKFKFLRVNMGELVIDFFSRTMKIINKMQIHDNNTEDITIIEKIIRSLTPKFNFIMSSIEKDKNIDELSIDELQSSLLIHEQKLNQQR
jgi:hypothetical protein